ncbi:hypothetical protein [Gemmata sp.]|uniref:hypothetical protein n=1 Tax=Gemmata sp. TaxID=1914242 RepID=UPI003F6E44BC
MPKQIATRAAAGARPDPHVGTPAPPARDRVAAGRHLNGQGGGTDTGSHALPDVGTVFDLSGTVALAGMGAFELTGWVRGVGFAARGRATGRVVLTDAHGTIALDLLGPLQPGFSPLPAAFTYTATGGTGAYRRLAAAGTAHFAFSPESGAFSVQFA